MNRIALIALITIATTAHSAQFLNLSAGSDYQVWTNGQAGVVATSVDGTLQVALATDTRYGLEVVDTDSTPTATPTETQDDPTATPTPTATHAGQELVVAGFNGTNNFFEVVADELSNGQQTVLPAVNVEATVKVADLDADGLNEVLAAASDDNGLHVEVRDGFGNTQFEDTLDTTDEFYLLTGEFDGVQGQDGLLVTRTADGAYNWFTLNEAGINAPIDNQLVAAGYDHLEAVFNSDLTGDSVEEVVVLARSTVTGAVDQIILADGFTTSSTILTGDYTGTIHAFPIDTDGNGWNEVAVIGRNSLNNQFKLFIHDADGQLVAKETLLSNKYDNNACFQAADVDGDSAEEIVAVGRLTRTGANILQVIEADGSKVISRSVLEASYNAVGLTTVADVDGDEMAEFVIGGRHEETGEVAYQVIELDGNLLTSAVAFSGSAATNPRVVTSDLNADNSDDVMVLGDLDGTYRVEFRNGQTGTELFTALTMTSCPNTVVAADLI